MRTAVVGAGPAGLLFCLIGKIVMGDAWSVELYDKRASYARTHRLRMAPEPYLTIQEALADARFDELIVFLREHRFSPEVNLLEEKLTELLSSVGVHKVVREITQLDDLDADTVVGADSVHSTTRDLVRGDLEPDKQVHERLARLRVTGTDLPARLSAVDQFRLSKVLGSVVDYRLNTNGFAEVDLFLTEEEHALVSGLGATPKDPVRITSALVQDVGAPLFRAIVRQLEGPGREVLVQSTFRLEHAVMPKVSFERGGKRVFLVGDASASLPFFRGMACLASSAHALARAHATGHFDDYDRDVRSIVRRELMVVRARAFLVGVLRELVRVSSMLPFPIQSWWLSAAKPTEPDRVSPGVAFNALVAAAAVVVSMLGLASPPLALLAVPVQIGGGVAYRWTLDLAPGPHRYLRRVWEVQIAGLLAVGAGLVATGHIHWLATMWWWGLGLAFVVGIYIFELAIARRISRAALE